MYLFVGLGNPGSEYHGTRHNIGFSVIDAIAEKFNTAFSTETDEYQIGWANRGGQVIALVKPITYMNNSGIAVKRIVEHYNMSLKELLVISDDINLPLGTIRIRTKGSDGGHNGLYSIIYHIESDEFPRLRCGIGSEILSKNKKVTAEFVLSPFEKSELETVENMTLAARNAAIEIAYSGIQRAMNLYNLQN